MGQLVILRVVVASPRDVQKERDAVKRAAEEVNRHVARDRGLRPEVYRWEIDAYPGFNANGPQGIIDRILNIEECDLIIGIFWKHFGTPTIDAQSGTEHEFRRALKAWKQKNRPQVMVYFNQMAYSPRSGKEIEQWGRVFEFKEHFPKEGLWWPYNGPEEFEGLVRDHLAQFVRDLPKQEPSRVGQRDANVGGILPEGSWEQHEKAKIVEALQRTNWNITKAAGLLGLTFRTLQYRLGKYGIHRP